MVKNVAYQAGLENFASALKAYGFSVYPWHSKGMFDALIFSEKQYTGFVFSIKPGKKSVFLLNVYTLTPTRAADILNARLYSPVFVPPTAYRPATS